MWQNKAFEENIRSSYWANFFDPCELLQNVHKTASEHRPAKVNEICTPPKFLRLVILCFRSCLDLRYRSGHSYNGTGHHYIDEKYHEKSWSKISRTFRLHLSVSWCASLRAPAVLPLLLLLFLLLLLRLLRLLLLLRLPLPEQELLKQRQETARQLTELYGRGATEPDDLSAERFTKKDVNIVNDMLYSVNPLAASLLPIQQMLGQIASYIRILRSIVSWDERINAFLILNSSIAVGVIFLFIPWGSVARWFFRLTIWIFLGRKFFVCMFLVLLMLMLFLLYFYGGFPQLRVIDTSLPIHSYNPFLFISK